MPSPVNIALTGLRNSSRRMETVAHNVANSATPGFMAQKVRSSDIAAEGSGLGVAIEAVLHSPVPGPLMPTDRWSDLAIMGDGFFAVADENGNIFYTRNGSFTVDENGNLMTLNGYRVLNISGNPVPSLPSGENFSVNSNGEIVMVSADGTITPLGPDYTIGIARIDNEDLMVSEGGTLYSLKPDVPAPELVQAGQGNGLTVLSGFVQMSNTDIAEEMVQGILAKTSYEANLKVVSTSNEMTENLLDTVG
ncbi:MAG TPA: flagellar hook basal-body protein [Thermodesulforhabdus norvegica]|uniref:Flagellar hook basal-body protein n=1 Tax=Thermodesulforhabdus norvegica TaxID=39841 RepID=A0A7C0WVD3_9BACT|nr:flagellar hook basal-body protein [Thermodesulforhabdus norvegica]